MTRAVVAAVLCLALAGCGDDPGDDTAQAACRAYAGAVTSAEQGAQLRATALERAQRAAEADDAYAPLQRDMTDAWSRLDATAAGHNGGRQVSGGELDAYTAADDKVRADCASAGQTLGPRQP